MSKWKKFQKNKQNFSLFYENTVKYFTTYIIIIPMVLLALVLIILVCFVPRQGRNQSASHNKQRGQTSSTFESVKID